MQASNPGVSDVIQKGPEWAQVYKLNNSYTITHSSNLVSVIFIS